MTRTVASRRASVLVVDPSRSIPKKAWTKLSSILLPLCLTLWSQYDRVFDPACLSEPHD